MTYQTLNYIQVDHVSEKEIDLQKWKEKIHTSATEDENAIADRQMIEKHDQESGDRQSAQTGHDRVDVRRHDRTNIIVPISTANLKLNLKQKMIHKNSECK